MKPNLLQTTFLVTRLPAINPGSLPNLVTRLPAINPGNLHSLVTPLPVINPRSLHNLVTPLPAINPRSQHNLVQFLLLRHHRCPLMMVSSPRTRLKLRN